MYVKRQALEDIVMALIRQQDQKARRLLREMLSMTPRDLVDVVPVQDYPFPWREQMCPKTRTPHEDAPRRSLNIPDVVKPYSEGPST